MDTDAIRVLIEESRRLRAHSERLSKVSAEIWSQIRTVVNLQVNDCDRGFMGMDSAAVEPRLPNDTFAGNDIEKTRARLAAIIETSDDAIVGKDLNGIITSWNQGAERMFGYTAEEAVGKPISIVIPSDRLHEESDILDRTRRGERVDHYETVRRSKDGTLLDISLTISPIIMAGGEVIGASQIARDIGGRKLTERKLRQSEARFRLMADSSPVMIWMTDRFGKALFLNRAFREYFALERDDTEAFDWFKAVHPDDRELIAGEFKTALLGQQGFQQRVRLRRYDGAWRWFESRGNLMVDESGNQIGFIGTSTDITEIYESQQALKDLDRRKDEFLATLSHELRNPLAPISNAVEILKTIHPAEPVLEWSRDLIDHQVRFLARLMEDLLDLSRITRGVLEIRKQGCDLRSVIHDAVESSRSLIEAAGHQLTVELPPESMALEADPIRLNQLFANILNNAAKYTEPNGKIWLAARVVPSTTVAPSPLPSPPEGGEGKNASANRKAIPPSPIPMGEGRGRAPKMEAVVSIKDSGIGIEADMLPRLFDMFAQAESGRSRRFGGLGIGLTLARTIVELHGGSIEAASEGLGKGSEFSVRLPLLRVPSDEGRVASGEEQASGEQELNTNHPSLATTSSAIPHSPVAGRCAGKRILIVDDNENQVESIAMLLKRRGCEVRAATDAWSALEILKEFVPEFAFIDIGLPGIDGFELARHIRASSELKNLVLIAETGWGSDEDRERSRQSGFDYHLTKPIDFNLVEKILATTPTSG